MSESQSSSTYEFYRSEDVAAACDSAVRLMQRAAADNAFVIYGHDPQQWDGLRKAPLIYD